MGIDMDRHTTILWIADHRSGSLPSYSALPRAFFSVMPCRLTTALRLIEERVLCDMIVIEPQPAIGDCDGIEELLQAAPDKPLIVFEDGGCDGAAKEYLNRGATGYVHDRSQI